MIMIYLVWASLILAGLPALLFMLNLFFYRSPPDANNPAGSGLSVLIPARNEEANIAAAVESVLRSEGVTLEVIVMDDHSEDRTTDIVLDMADRDARVRLAKAPELPPDWCGKQHACASLAKHARYPLFVFLDADVRLAPTALRQIWAFMELSGADLVSGFPHEETKSLGEAMVIPLIHFLLLGFLPIPGMRWSRHPAFSAGCGQLFVAHRSAYEESGGHAAIKSSMHDGLTLPHAFRKAGFKTDLVDATKLAHCRMYRGFSDLWQGLIKNAIEGVAAPARILPFTLLLLGGQAVPFILLPVAFLSNHTRPTVALVAMGVALAWLPRLLCAWRFRQSALGALLHPVGVCVFVAAQWIALARWIVGRPASWKGRQYRLE